MKKVILLLSLILFSLSLTAQQTANDGRGYKVTVGEKAPDFTIKYLDGTTKKLSDLQGKTVMIQFTASWCGVCRVEMPFIEREIWLKHKNNANFVLIGVDYKETLKTTVEFAKMMNITYPLTLDEDGEIFYRFANKDAGVTRNIIIDKNGNIAFLTRLFNEQEFGQMKEVIEKLLKL